MATKTLLMCGVALLHIQSTLAVPVSSEFPSIVVPRGNVTVDPPKTADPIISEITMTAKELEEYIKSLLGGSDKRSSGTEALEPRSTGTDGALLTFIDGDVLPGAGNSKCEDFVLNGPFTSIHAIMGTSNVRRISATSYSGNSSEIGNTEVIVDSGEFKFANNERITKFSIGRLSASPNVAAFTFETDAGNKYEALSGLVKDGSNTPVYEELTVGSGIIGRIRGSYCSYGTMGSFGVDFIDELGSISISNIDYSGFTNNIMPTGAGTQMSVGSQILDNRNSSEKQTITLTTTDTITRQSTVTTQIRALVGGSVAIEAGAGIPLVSEGKVRTEANWQLETSSVSYAPGTP